MSKLKRFGEFESARAASLKEADKEQDTPWLIDGGERSILGVQWRSAGKSGTLGIVAVKNLTMDYWCAYIGLAADVDQKQDAEEIASWGGKLTEAEARAFFPNLKDEKYKMKD